MVDEARGDQEKPTTEKEDGPENVTSVLKLINENTNESDVKKALWDHIVALAKKHKVDKYKILFLFDENDDISHWHANRLYKAATAGKKRNILLIAHSRGGRIEPAYLISKTCSRLSDDKFVVAVPRKAKSAATLIALGAKEIHMGLMSELGPIDPQIGGFPALGLQNALSLLADISCKYPESSKMLGQFLSEKLDLRILGYFERVSESAVQYAERLLEGKELPERSTPSTLANHFVNHYKDHGFVIDGDEASRLLGDSIIRQDTPEYAFSNEVYESLDILKIIYDISLNKVFDLVGDAESGLFVRDAKKNNQ